MKNFIPAFVMFGTATIGLILDEKSLFLGGIGLTILCIVIGILRVRSE